MLQQLKIYIWAFALGIGLASPFANRVVAQLLSGQDSTPPTQIQSAEGSATTATTNVTPIRAPDVVYVPTPREVVDAMLALAEVREGDILYDLGSGDGRIPITAVQKYNATRSVGIEINPKRIEEAEANRASAGVADRVRFRNEDLFEADIHEATVVTLYLLTSLNLRLIPKLLKDLQPGTRIVSHSFDMGSWKAEKVIEVDKNHVYLWRIPAPGTPEHAAALAAAGSTLVRK
jgi:precorrin-6B methylase 2